jgi:hypothetical protein
MQYDTLTPAEAEREIERLEHELEHLRDSDTQPERQKEIALEIERLKKADSACAT